MELDIQEAGAAGSSLAAGIVRLTAASAQLERTAAALDARLSMEALGGEVAKVVAAVDAEPSARLIELEAKLNAAERQIGELRAQASVPAAGPAGRKTLPAAAAHLLAKHGIDTLDQVNGNALDAALTGLSLEQRIAVKSQLMRAGLLG